MPKNLSKTDTETISLNNLSTLVITLIIGVILTVSVISPVINDAQHQNDVVYSNPAPYSYCKLYEFSEDDTEDTTVITICKSGEHSVTVNGVSHNVSTYQPVLVSDGATIRFYSNSMNLSTLAGSFTVTDVTLTISGGVATFSNVLRPDSTEITLDPVSIGWAFVHDNDGDFSALITESGITAYAHKNGIYSANWINTTSEFFSIQAGSDVVKLSTTTDATTTTLNWGGEYQENGVYKMTLNSTSDDFTFTVDNNGEDYTVHPFIIVVPKTLTGTPDEQSVINSLLGVIPVIVIAGLLVSAAGAIVIRARD